MNEVIDELLRALGGVAIVLSALFAFIGRAWLSRIIERERGDIQGKIAKLQSDLGKTTKKLESELQKSVHIHKIQFEHEFSIYKEIWEALIELRMATMRLRPMFDYVDPQQSLEDLQRERISAFAEPFERFRDYVEKNKPFYSPKVYESLIEVLERCYGESIDFEYKERKNAEYFKEARENHKQILKAIEVSCTEIRERIAGVSVV